MMWNDKVKHGNKKIEMYQTNVKGKKKIKKKGRKKKKLEFAHESIKTLWRYLKSNFNVPVLNFSIFSIMPCGIHELSDVAPPSREMLFCGAANVFGTVLWNEVFYIITIVFGGFCGAGTVRERRLQLLISSCSFFTESGSTEIMRLFCPYPFR